MAADVNFIVGLSGAPPSSWKPPPALFFKWHTMSAIPMKDGILTREQILIASKRVQKIDQELASFAENNYLPHGV